MMKIATWNVNSLNVRLNQVKEWLIAEQPDLLALQEIKLLNEKFPGETFESIGYHALVNGQKTYNGVALLSKTAFEQPQFELPNYEDVQKRVLAATVKGLRILNFYIPNGESIESLKYQYKLAWLEAATQYISAELVKFERVLVVGDFNIAPEDRDVHDPASWKDHILCSKPERKYFQKWLELGFIDSFRLFEQPEQSYSWWDYRMAAFRRNMGLRIDHILISQTLKNSCTRAWIDKTPRKLERPSDHTPVVVEIKMG